MVQVFVCLSVCSLIGTTDEVNDEDIHPFNHSYRIHSRLSHDRYQASGTSASTTSRRHILTSKQMQKLGIYPLFRLGVVEEVTRSFVIVFRKLDIGRTDILDASFGFGRTGGG